MLGTGYFLKIAKINSQQEKPLCPNQKISSHKTQKVANQQKLTPAKISCHTVSSLTFLHAYKEIPTDLWERVVSDFLTKKCQEDLHFIDKW